MSRSNAFAPVTLGRVGSTLTLGQIRLTETFHAGGSRLRMHDHEDYTVNVVLEGLVEERVGRRTRVSLHPDPVPLAPPALRHTARRSRRPLQDRSSLRCPRYQDSASQAGRPDASQAGLQ